MRPDLLAGASPGDDDAPPPVYILNGPNLNLLGRFASRTLYGRHHAGARSSSLCACASPPNWAFQCEFRQSNHEGVLVDWLQEAR